MIERLVEKDGWIECEACSDEIYRVYHKPGDPNCEESQCQQDLTKPWS
jgi:mannose-6-phosphate isomerase class I